jgi:hypothetical protein
MAIIAKRILGPLNQFPVEAAQGGGSLTIQNNVSGRLLRATGGASTISGVTGLSFDGDEFDVSMDLYVQGSGNNLFIDGTNDSGTSTKFRIEIVGGVLKTVPVS